MGDDEKKYRIFRRSSEMQIKLTGDSQAQILSDAGFALFDLLVDPATVEATDSVFLEVEGTDSDELMANWIRELLYAYQTSGYVLKEFNILEIGEHFVRAEAKGEKCDPDRHEEREDVGAVAGRLCRLGKMGDQWTAQVGFEF